jgi:hypothetical protein
MLLRWQTASYQEVSVRVEKAKVGGAKQESAFGQQDSDP